MTSLSLIVVTYVSVVYAYPAGSTGDSYTTTTTIHPPGYKQNMFLLHQYNNPSSALNQSRNIPTSYNNLQNVHPTNLLSDASHVASPTHTSTFFNSGQSEKTPSEYNNPSSALMQSINVATPNNSQENGHVSANSFLEKNQNGSKTKPSSSGETETISTQYQNPTNSLLKSGNVAKPANFQHNRLQSTNLFPDGSHDIASAQTTTFGSFGQSKKPSTEYSNPSSALMQSISVATPYNNQENGHDSANDFLGKNQNGSMTKPTTLGLSGESETIPTQYQNPTNSLFKSGNVATPANFQQNGLYSTNPFPDGSNDISSTQTTTFSSFEQSGKTPTEYSNLLNTPMQSLSVATPNNNQDNTHISANSFLENNQDASMEETSQFSSLGLGGINTPQYKKPISTLNNSGHIDIVTSSNNGGNERSSTLSFSDRNSDNAQSQLSNFKYSEQSENLPFASSNHKSASIDEQSLREGSMTQYSSEYKTNHGNLNNPEISQYSQTSLQPQSASELLDSQIIHETQNAHNPQQNSLFQQSEKIQFSPQTESSHQFLLEQQQKHTQQYLNSQALQQSGGKITVQTQDMPIPQQYAQSQDNLSEHLQNIQGNKQVKLGNKLLQSELQSSQHIVENIQPEQTQGLQPQHSQHFEHDQNYVGQLNQPLNQESGQLKLPISVLAEHSQATQDSHPLISSQQYLEFEQPPQTQQFTQPYGSMESQSPNKLQQSLQSHRLLFSPQTVQLQQIPPVQQSQILGEMQQQGGNTGNYVSAQGQRYGIFPPIVQINVIPGIFYTPSIDYSNNVKTE